ncbi:hypothetical protein U1Q18_025678 [Sarracenia purpurea var. burkii]
MGGAATEQRLDRARGRATGLEGDVDEKSRKDPVRDDPTDLGKRKISPLDGVSGAPKENRDSAFEILKEPLVNGVVSNETVSEVVGTNSRDEGSGEELSEGRTSMDADDEENSNDEEEASVKYGDELGDVAQENTALVINVKKAFGGSKDEGRSEDGSGIESGSSPLGNEVKYPMHGFNDLDLNR